MTKPETIKHLILKAPASFFERLDRWCEAEQQARGMTMRPSRPAAIRWIVHTHLLKQEQLRKRRRKRR
jgi:hypothetical protein